MDAAPDGLRHLPRPPVFSGRDDEWPDWSFTARAYMSMISDDVAALLDRVESVTVPTTLSMCEQSFPNCLPYVRQLDYQLAMFSRGPALAVLKTVEKNNGIEAWRRLYQRCEPDDGARVQNMMNRILNPGTFPDTPQGFETALLAWELLTEKWESSTNSMLSEQVKISVLVARAPEKIRGFLQLQGFRS